MRKKPSPTSSSWVAKSMTASRMLRPAASLIPMMLIPDQQPGEGDPDDDVPRVRPQRLPEDREVVRDEDHRDCDGDHVVEHLRPRGPERDQLVERVAGEARRATRLRIADRALGVRRSRRCEDHAADDEDDRGEAERDARRQAERVVDRGADVPVGSCEQRRCAQHPLEAMRLSAPPGHGTMLFTNGGNHVSPVGPLLPGATPREVAQASRRAEPGFGRDARPTLMERSFRVT